MFRTGIFLWITMMLAAPHALGTHDGGEEIEVMAASNDGRYVLAVWRDINSEDVKVGLHDVTTGAFLVQDELAASDLKKRVRALRRKYRLRRLPRARHCRTKRNVCAFFYTWTHKDSAESRSVALVGPLGQTLGKAQQVPCFREAAECKAKSAQKATPATAYWFGNHTVLVAATWVVKRDIGDTHVPIFTHRRLPKPPQIPAAPPTKAVD